MDARVPITEWPHARNWREERALSRDLAALGPHLSNAEHFRSADVVGSANRAGLDKLGQPDSGISRGDGLERQVRCPDRDRQAQQSVDQFVELREALDRPANLRLLHDLLGSPFRPVVGESVAVDADDGHVDDVSDSSVGGGSEHIGRAVDLGRPCPPKRVRCRMHDAFDVEHRVPEASAGSHVSSSDGGAWPWP